MAWLRQIHTENYLFVNPLTAGAEGIADGGWMWVESPWARCAACAATPRPWSRNRVDLEMPSARPPAPGT